MSLENTLKILLVLVVISISAVWTYEDYKNYKIYEISTETDEQLQSLYKIMKEKKNYDFWNLARKSNEISKVLIPPHIKIDLEKTMDKYGINYTLTVDDVSQEIAQERKENSRETPLEFPLNVFERYYRYDEINGHMDYLAKTYPTRAFVKQFGVSYEGRPLRMVTITNGDGRTDKNIIFIDAGMHAREWITHAMALHIMNELTENYNENKKFLENYDWIIMPVVNADGYEYTHEVGRYWRKTRRPSDLELDCYGIDPNRNFDFYWGLEEGASPDPCDETYHGEKAFSEPETQVVRDIMITYADRMKWYLSLHSYGNYILLPWGHTNQLPENYFEMVDVADVGVMAIVRSTNSVYTYGNTYNVMYPTSGDSADYAVGVLNVPISMAMELPAGGGLGFDPPVRQIEMIVKETWIGIHAMAESVIEKY